MSDQDWEKAKEIFGEAVKLSPSEWPVFLDNTCATDQTVRREVESLLSSFSDAESFMESPAAGDLPETIAETNIFINGFCLGHYEIINQIGSGGMGAVYLAHDKKLDRKVAIKILNETFSQHESNLQRFIQEAKAASSLNHPNILVIHEFGETDDAKYIVSEFIEGKTLREMFNEKSLEFNEFLNISIQVADALDIAHAAHLVHRDIKPENIMIRSDGYIKILDFGLAKLVEQRALFEPGDEIARHNQTAEGMILGTVNYMSPEQACGKKIDERTDIFSFGVVMYEMLAGKAPFSGDSPSEVIASILKTEPDVLPDNTPARLKRIVSRALSKNQDERYQYVKDLLNDLREFKENWDFEAKLERSAAASGNGEVTAGGLKSFTKVQYERNTLRSEFITGMITNHKLGSGILSVLIFSAVAFGFWFFNSSQPGAKQIDSIAVMPFVNESGNAELEYLSDGMTETLINSLSQIPKLSVKASSTVFRYKGKGTDAQTIGKELKVQAILTGRVVQRSAELILYLELVDAKTGDRIWGGQYNRKTTDLVSLQTEIAHDVSEKLRLKLSGAVEQRLAKHYTENVEAYQLYLKGQYAWKKGTEKDLLKSIDFFNQALEKDPNYGLAYTGIASAYGVLGTTYSPPGENFPKSKANADKALAIDDTLAKAHLGLGAYNLFYEWDWAAAEKGLERAVSLDPNDGDAHQVYADYLAAMGRLDEALAEAKRAQEIDPLSERFNNEVLVVLYYQRKYDETIAEFHKMVELEPRFVEFYIYPGQAYIKKKMYPEAIATFQKGITLGERHPSLIAGLGHVYALAGERKKAQKLLDELLELSKRRYVNPYAIAFIYFGLEDKEQGFKWLEKAYQERWWYLIMLNSEPMFDDMRNDPRFQDLIRRIGLQA